MRIDGRPETVARFAWYAPVVAQRFDIRPLLLLIGLAALPMCAGKAVIDPETDGGDDGSGASGATGPGGPTNNGPITAISTVTTGPGGGACVDDTFGQSRADAGDCRAACEILFCCADRECAALESGDKDAFVDGCIDDCNQMMAVIAVTNGEDCPGTVNIIRSASQSFADTCDNGL